MVRQGAVSWQGGGGGLEWYTVKKSVELLAVSCGWSNISGHCIVPGIFLTKAAEGICCWMEKEAETVLGTSPSLTGRSWVTQPGRGLEAPSQGGLPELEGGQSEEGADREVPAREHQGEDPVQADH
jgi:hypothetical protein